MVFPTYFPLDASVIPWMLSLPRDDANALNISTFKINSNIEVDCANHFCLMVFDSPTVFYVARNQWRHLWSLMVNSIPHIANSITITYVKN